MLLRHPFITLLTLLAIPTRVLGRKGGPDGDNDSDSSSGSGSSGSGGSSDSDSSSDSSDGGDTSSTTSTGYHCTDTHRLDFGDLRPNHYEKYISEAHRNRRLGSVYSDWDGVYFKGETLFTYTITIPTNKSAESSSSIECPIGEHTMRMLGVAWVAAKAPGPKGPINPFTVGFKAWESNIRVSDIDYSYSQCENLDLIRFCTTVDWHKKEGENDAMDAVELNITQAAEDSNKIDFDGVYDLKDWADSERDSFRPARYDNGGLWDQQIMLPERLCSDGNKLGKLFIGWPTGTRVNGSMTNETLEMNFSGSVNGAQFERIYNKLSSRVATADVAFEIKFTGKIDAANSSQVVLTGASSNNASLIAFERATSSAFITRLSWYFLPLSLLVAFGVLLV
ncbi:hypothetical protein N7457_002073 [Penicillium paradoxum]|uniref:uncharacterized protein n=1 Tax=Penicillium paradoxum TaxID=176176 RepID=UPI002549389B|nr:uncharacterized protein N7457_002073 [Penicillium paradoxum]KAJ5787083.1 hypothetical protein N7457_002073 [Penicillium paradoxum]